MPTDQRAKLQQIRTFPSLIRYLREEMGWPIDTTDFEEVTFQYTPEELGIDAKNAAKIEDIRRLRPLSIHQPWGIFFVKFEPKRLPVIALRRILSQVALKKRASANSPDRTSWAADDLLFVSNYGQGEQRQISFAHFSQPVNKQDLPTLKVLGWDNLDTGLHLDAVAEQLTHGLAWPDNDEDASRWRDTWRRAFILRNREVITTSRDLSIRLAGLARAIRDRIRAALSIETETGPLTTLMTAFREALVHDLDQESFADMYAQTVAYGLLSARLANPRGKSADGPPPSMPVTNPFLKELMEAFLQVGGQRGPDGGQGIDFDELGVSEVVDLLDDANMEAVIQDFGDRNPREDPVIHFYELFLKEYDAKQKMQRGVFYTPRPVVAYIVRSVDELLRTTFGLEDGLADTSTWAEMCERYASLSIPDGVDPDQAFVQILDPATGTGTFLVEAINLIHHRMVEKWTADGHREKGVQALWNDYVSEHLLPRLYGYELLMAPYAIAHLKIGIKLYETGYRFGSEQRVRVYLTNSLDPAHESTGQFDLMTPALAHEAAAVNDVKRNQVFTVIIGNPPYSERSKNDNPWIDALMERYKTTIRSEEAQIKAVSNDYVKFLCLAHHLIEQARGMGLVGLITSNGYLDGRLFRDLRREWLRSFARLFVLNLHGSGRRGDAEATDENVFDILQGVAVIVAMRWLPSDQSEVRFGEMIGRREAKYERLLAEVVEGTCGSLISPRPPLTLFVPSEEAENVLARCSLAEIFGTGNPSADRNRTYAGGFKTRQDSFTVALDEETLRGRIAELADKTIPEDELRRKYGLCSTAHFDFAKARRAAQAGVLNRSIRTLRYRPFDDRPMIWAREVLCEPQIAVSRHLLRPNLCLVSSRVVKDDAYRHVSVARGPVEVISLSTSTSTNAYMFPLYRYEGRQILAETDDAEARVANLSKFFIDAMAAATGLRWDGDGGSTEEGTFTPEEVLWYIYAVLHVPSFRDLYADDLLRDFPKIPLPANSHTFLRLARMGERLVELHLGDSYDTADMPTVVGERVCPVVRVSYANGTVWLDKERTSGFAGVSEAVWNFQVGGYRVCEKWLKARQAKSVVRARHESLLSDNDVLRYQQIIAVLSETIRIMEDLDSVIHEQGGWPNAFVLLSETPSMAD